MLEGEEEEEDVFSAALFEDRFLKMKETMVEVVQTMMTTTKQDSMAICEVPIVWRDDKEEEREEDSEDK